MPTRLTFYNKKIQLTLFSNIHISKRSITTLVFSSSQIQGTYLTIPPTLRISKRFVRNPRGPEEKILETLARKVPPPAPVRNILQDATRANKPNTKEMSVNTETTLTPSELKSSFKEKVVDFGAKVFGMVPTPQKTTNLITESYHVRQNKEIILDNLRYFDTVPFEKTKDNEHLLLYLHALLKNNPQSLLLRQAQVVQEILFNKRPFEEELVRELFTAFEIIDIIGKNKGFMDASTLYSVLASTYLYENFDFLKAVDPRIIYSGCVYPLTGLTKEQEDFINQSKAATGNTICDASLALKKYDMKALPSPTNNYIVLWNYESFNLHGDVMKSQNALYSYLKKVPEVHRTIFQQKLLELFNNLKDAPLDILQKQMILNEFIVKALPIMKITDRASLIFPVTSTAFKPNAVYDDAVKEINIPIKRSSIDSAETKKAIMGIVNTWDMSKKSKFTEVTYTEKEDLDI